MPELTCFRLLDAESPAGPLAEAVRHVNAGKSGPEVFTLDPVSFEQVPNAPFAYWVEEKVRLVFKDQKAFESDSRTAKAGLCTGDDFRFVRCWWEVASMANSASNKKWLPFAKGGAYSPFYSDLHLSVDWEYAGANMQPLPGARVQNTNYFYRSGITWPLRTDGLSFRLLPVGCVFGHKGPAAFDQASPISLCGLLNTKCFGHLVSVQLARVELAQSFEVGIIQNTPVPEFSQSTSDELSKYAYACWSSARNLDTVTETSHTFVAPWRGVRLQPLNVLDSDQRVTKETHSEITTDGQMKIERIAEQLYGFKAPLIQSCRAAQLDVGEEGDESASDNIDVGRMTFSYLTGVAFGRWAVPANPEELRKPPTDPFAPLPAQAPGAAPVEAAKLYFAEDDSGESPLLNGCRAALRQATSLDSVDAYEQDLAARLGVPTLRDYLSRPAGFFADHLSVYSKSRRKAPIYWPLSTKSGNFTLWVYYPKLDEQSLPKLIADVLSPKIRTLTQEIENRRATPGGKIGELETLRLELEEMRTDFLDLINRGYCPNQNDGVLITACPLAKYFRHAGFRKNLDACWKELCRGDYDWAHLAMSMWPERVLAACRNDRSIAIAHGKEDLCPAEPAKGSRGRKKKAD